jgi:hypothetical protein
MGYLSAAARKTMTVDHYQVACDFEVTVIHTCVQEMTLLHPEAQNRRFLESWNTILDFHATLKPIKPAA